MERSVGSRSREWWNLFMLFINTQFFYIFLLSCLFNGMNGLMGVLCDFFNIMQFNITYMIRQFDILISREFGRCIILAWIEEIRG